jgi:DNA-binding NtrC family response regulator
MTADRCGPPSHIPMQKILVIDDNEGVCKALEVLFSLHGLPIAAAFSPQDGLEQIRNGGVDLVIQDMNFTADTTSGEEGQTLFRQIREIDPDLPVILFTAWTDLQTAVELVKEGAADYMGKPWDDEKLLATARNLLELRAVTAENQLLVARRIKSRSRLARDADLCGTVYESDSMHTLLATAIKVAASDVAVLVTGPNGCGKEKVADIIQANSRVADGPFIKVNMGALPAELMEAELFGADAGAYTGADKVRVGRFEAADGGTLFLDEIGNLSAEGQAKLLRVLQTGEFERLGSSATRRTRVRIIAATNIDLREAIADRRFREDLFYRLNVIELEVPPLAERPDDILPLAQFFLGAGHELEDGIVRALADYPWPGNVRELQNCMQRASVLAGDEPISLDMLGLDPGLRVESQDDVLIDRNAVVSALEKHGGTVARAARSLGISRQALYRRMEKFGIPRT